MISQAENIKYCSAQNKILGIYTAEINDQILQPSIGMDGMAAIQI